MRARFHVHLKALQTSAFAAMMLLVLGFFFYDGPLTFSLPRVEASAQAKERINVKAMQTNDTQDLLASSIPLELTGNFTPQWELTSFDQGKVRLNMLKTPFQLANTHQKSGSEAFAYAAFLFRQMAQEVKEADLANELQMLSMQAQSLGMAIHKAGTIQFSGPPNEEMPHIKVKEALQRQLNRLNTGALIAVKYKQTGEILTKVTPTAGEAGPDLNRFMQQARLILQHPKAANYPQTMTLIQKESDLLASLAQHLTLRWESTLYCPNACDSIATHMRVYAAQTLPEHTLASATI